MTDGTNLLYFQLKAAGLPLPEREFPFDPARKWRADFAWVSIRLLVEVEGGVYSQGRHVRGTGYTHDLEKYNAAVIAGWRVLRYSTGQVEDGTALAQLEKVLKGGDPDNFSAGCYPNHSSE